MSIQDLERAFELIAQSGGDFEGKKDDSLVCKAEHVLRLPFPESYKRFIKRFGAGDIGGLEFYGLIGEGFENSGIPDAVWLTLEERKSGLPEHLVLVYATGDGAYCALDTNRMNPQRECPVIRYEADGSVEEVAEDYGAFLLAELRTILPAEVV